VLNDQKDIWTAPFHMDRGQMKRSIPFAVGLGALIATDSETSEPIPRDGDLGAVSKKVSLGGDSVVDASFLTGMFVVGRLTNKPRLRETAVLSAEAWLDSSIVVGALKHVARRLRPNSDGGSGEFFDHELSFPSGHSSSAWSIATVIAYEYNDRPAIKYSAYAAATAVAIARYTGRSHFISDVAVGSAIGFYTGRFVYKKRHNAGLDDPPGPDTTHFLPVLTPLYDRRSDAYGLRATWRM